jgi:UDP-3-O-[3-hydroxymyristoyl] glucosamine N-acyltransferase
VLCFVQFAIGRAIGRQLGEEVNAGQALFQKNTALSIWVAYMYLNPVASIGAGCYVSAQCVVGDGCVLHPNVVLDNRVVLGHHCEIKSGAVLGQEGFGFERNEQGEPVHFPHFGDVIVGNNVFIGSNTTVERATLGSTVIEDNVKIDDLVQIGHNSHIGEGSMVTVGAIVCGGAELKPQSYLAPNVTVKEKVTMGYRGFAGIGAVVLKDVADNTVVAGVPAKEIIRNK